MTIKPCLWYNELPVIFKNQKLYPRNVNKERILSPLTDLFLSSACFTLKKKKNFFLSIQSNKLDCLLILASLSARILKGNIIFFTDDPRKAFDTFFELQNPQGFLFYITCGGIFKKINNDKFELHLPKYYQKGAKKSYRKELIKKNLLSKIRDPNQPSIIFADYSEIRKNFRINSIKFENEKSTLKIEFPIKGIIFSSFNNHFFGERYYQSFIEWTKNVLLDKWLFIHFNDPLKKLNHSVIESLDMEGFYFNRSFLCQNRGISKFMNNYWEDPNVKCGNLEKSAWNIDNSYLYDLNSSDRFEIISIPKCNIDEKFRIAKILFNELKMTRLPNDIYHELLRFRSLLYKIQCRFSNPASHWIKFPIGDRWYVYIYEIIKFFKKLLKSVSNEINRAKLNEFCIQFYGIYRELEETSRIYENNTYNRKGMDSILIEKLLELNQKPNNNHELNIIILCFDNDDAKSLYKLCEICNLKLNYEFSIESIHKFHIQNIKENSILILPGIPFSNYFYIFSYSWKKIIIFSHSGQNKNHAQYFIDSFNKTQDSEEALAAKYILKFWDFIGFEKSYSIVKKYFKNDINNEQINDSQSLPLPQDSKFSTNIKTEEKTKYDWLDNLKTNLSSELGIMKEESKFFEEEEIEQVIQKETEEKIKQNERESITEHGVSNFQVINQNSGETEIIVLHNDVPYIVFTKKKDGSFEKVELLPKHIYINKNQEKYLIYFKESARRSFIGIIKEMIDISEDVDFDLIQLWKTKLFQAIPENRSIKSQHEEFLNYSKISQSQFGKWIKGDFNYTMDPNDLRYLGIIYDIPIIKENYVEIHYEGKKIHRIHQRIGMMLSRIIKQEINKNLNVENLNKEEESIQKFIRNNIYLLMKKI